MQTFLDPAILFFVFGVLAGLLRSNLEIPPAISRFLSLYLLMTLGLKGGFALAASGITQAVISSLGTALLLAVVVPLLGYWLLRHLLGGFDAAAIAATYGSVSAVTFITAVNHMESHGYAFGAHMPAAMALMEAPAIFMAILFASILRRGEADSGLAPKSSHTTRSVLRDALTDGTQLMLVGAMLIGYLTGAAGEKVMQGFTGDLFKGMLCFFLLDMGMLAARSIRDTRGLPPMILAYAVFGPLVHAGLALFLARMFGISSGDAGLLMVLAASASYIAVPAALKMAIPEARPALYFGLSLGVTFPLNILFGIPMYIGVARQALS
ncbi:MAG: hypothetical protein RL434_2720 [Pseudomonadota bacterium]|jgi:hypothetical protein